MIKCLVIITKKIEINYFFIYIRITVIGFAVVRKKNAVVKRRNTNSLIFLFIL